MNDAKIKIPTIICAFLVTLFLAAAASAQTLKTAVLRIGETGGKFHEKLRAELAKQNFLRLVDDDLSSSALRALNYQNPFNLSLEEAKNLGAAIDCQFFFVVKSDILRRSSFKKDIYFESYANIFLVSARTGRLAAWESVSQESDASEAAEKQLLTQTEKIAARFAGKIRETEAAERVERSAMEKTSLFAEISDTQKAESENIRTPLPYRNLKPAYTDAAEHFEVEAAVEVSVELNAKGEVENVEIQRWAGFGLDDAAIEIVRKMQFRPALRNGEAIPARFVLRYNFRRLRQEKD